MVSALFAAAPLPPERQDDPASEPAQSISIPSASLPPCKAADPQSWDQCTGTLQLGDLGEYSGEIQKGRPEGSGRFLGRDGSLYQGGFRAGVPSGKGKFTSPKGSIYIGDFSGGVANGKGRETASDGTLYSGNFVNGVREGQGRLTFPDGRIYEGEFRGDRADGYGTYSFRDGSSFTGVVVRDELTDRGIYRFANGDRYVGMFRNFKPSGPGVYTSVSGLKWIGSFSDGIPKGRGTLYDSNGELIREGEFDGFSSFANAKAVYDARKKQEAESQRPAANSASKADVLVAPQQSPRSSQIGSVELERGNAAAQKPTGDTVPEIAPKSEPNISSAPSSSEPASQDDGIRPPLACRRAGDLLISFITCEVLMPQVSIETIRFEGDACRSGTDYLAEYDQARSAPLTDMYNRAKAYFYFRPFDYRGVHRYRDKVYFLSAGCRSIPAFTIAVNGQEWNWPVSADRPTQIKSISR